MLPSLYALPFYDFDLSSRSCVTSQVHEAFLRAIFAPAGHRLNVFLRRRAPADLSIACPLM